MKKNGELSLGTVKVKAAVRESNSRGSERIDFP